MTKQPNVVYIHSHGTGRYIQPYGYAIPTKPTTWRRATAMPTC